MRKLVLLAAAVTAAFICGSAIAAPVVKTIGIADARAVLVCPESPKASVILVPNRDRHINIGFDGKIRRQRNNELVRTRYAYAARGLAVLVVDVDVDLALAIDTMRKMKPPVSIIAIGLGTVRVAQAIADGARPDALVLMSGVLTNASGSRENVANVLGTPAQLPPTLVIHHRRDKCSISRPAGVAPFIKWADGRARAVWLNGGHNGGEPCDGRAYHGFAGLDAKVVSAAARFR